MAEKETGKRVRKPVVVRAGDSTVVDPKTGQVMEVNGEKVAKKSAMDLPAQAQKGEASDA